MIDELNKAYENYQTKWNDFVKARTDQEFFTTCAATAVAWKTQDLDDFNNRLAELRDKCDKIVLTWMNERWVAKLHLKADKIGGKITIIKLMQRRPNSTDTVGLDHVDFYCPKAEQAEAVLSKESSLKWTEEENGPCKWKSIWFDGTEAKIRSDTVIMVIVDELKELNDQILANI